MASKKRAGSSYKAQYTAYKAENRAKRNKIKNLEKRILANENDVGAVEALKIVNQKTKFRQKPGSKGWFHPQEQKLKALLNDKDPSIVKKAAADLANLISIYEDKRPSAARKSPNIAHTTTNITDELITTGLINEKRVKSIKSRVDRIRKR
jgi:hypothetical protein